MHHQPRPRREMTDPFSDLHMLLQRAFYPANTVDSDVVTSHWMPLVDIREEETRFLIEADIPGVDPKDIEVHMDKGVLTIKGQRTQEKKEQENDRPSRTERVHGSFHRRFDLPDSADPENIQATGKNGVLTIVIPKRPASTPRRIQVS